MEGKCIRKTLFYYTGTIDTISPRGIRRHCKIFIDRSQETTIIIRRVFPLSLFVTFQTRENMRANHQFPNYFCKGNSDACIQCCYLYVAVKCIEGTGDYDALIQCNYLSLEWWLEQRVFFQHTQTPHLKKTYPAVWLLENRGVGCQHDTINMRIMLALMSDWFLCHCESPQF